MTEDIERLPMFLTVEDVAKVMGIGKPNAYELFKRQDFPSIRVGRRLVVAREAFLRWAGIISA